MDHGWRPQIAGRSEHGGDSFRRRFSTAELTELFALGDIQAAGVLQQAGGFGCPQFLAGGNLFGNLYLLVRQELGGSGATGSAGPMVVPVNFPGHFETSLQYSAINEPQFTI